MHLQELKTQTPTQLVDYAEELEIENANSMRRQDLMFAILKQLAENEHGDLRRSGVLEIRSRTASAFLRAPEANYLAGPDDIYVSPEPDPPILDCAPAIRSRGRFAAPKDGERYFALLKVNTINFDPIPRAARHRVNFDDLTPLYPEERIILESGRTRRRKDTQHPRDRTWSRRSAWASAGFWSSPRRAPARPC